ncbi:MAG: M28 family peptidase [Phycisphaerales bacterium]|nr:M28 family peptidase [Phycisphaerales bacterium]
MNPLTRLTWTASFLLTVTVALPATAVTLAADETTAACFCMSLAEACESCQAVEEAHQTGSEPFFATTPVRLTSPEQYSRAGEAYFSPDRKWIIFQAVPVDEETGDSPIYAMYVAALVYDADGNPTGLEPAIRLSAPGSANTCGWFHPTLPGVVLYGSTITTPKTDDNASYQRDNSRYSWEFPREMEIVSQTVSEIVNREVTNGSLREQLLARQDLDRPVPIFSRDGYDAEGSWSPCGRFILYTHVKPGKDDGDLYMYDIAKDTHTPLITEPGYDGGPFFSPDGTRICYRSDRELDDLLQLFVADLAFGPDGSPTGIARETRLTDDGHVNWAPFFHYPSGEYLLYATSNISHRNYEVFAIPANTRADGGLPMPVRVTEAAGFDGLPVFCPAGELVMWTGQRDTPDATGRRSSQLYLARTAMDIPPDLKLDTPGASTPSESSAPIADAFASATPETRAFAEHTTILASPFMQGRFPGTIGIERAEAYIADHFESLGLGPAFGRGSDGTYFQTFDFALRSDDQDDGEEATTIDARNVAAILKGRGELASRYIVIGAHHDHLGYGEHGSLEEEAEGQLHEGADDNASGTAGVLLAAELLTRRYAELPPSADARSIIFTTFSAEELGLNGSRFFVENSPRPIDQVDLMINFDMIGRVTGDRVSITGSGTSVPLADLVTDASSRSPLNVEQPPGLTARSDHAAFYDAEVPVLFFTITPFHSDYHTPMDESWKLNRRGGAMIAGLAADVAANAAQQFDEFAFTEIEGYEQRTGPSRGDMRVRFGVMPGNYNDTEPGIDIERVSRGGSAESGGVLKGDRLMEWNGTTIMSVGHWMELMGEHEPGDVVTVTVTRDGEQVDLPVTLQAAGG